MDKIIKPGIVLFIIATLAATLLGYMYELTLPYIKNQEETAKTEAMQEVMEDANEFVEINDIDTENTTLFSLGLKDGEVTGVVIGTRTNGYGGPIDMLTGIDTSGTITGIAIVNMIETPGLGLNANDKEFRDKFVGKSGQLSVVKGVPNDSQIDAISSATITTEAIVEGVNIATSTFDTHKEVVK